MIRECAAQRLSAIPPLFLKSNSTAPIKNFKVQSSPHSILSQPSKFYWLVNWNWSKEKCRNKIRILQPCLLKNQIKSLSAQNALGKFWKDSFLSTRWVPHVETSSGKNTIACQDAINARVRNAKIKRPWVHPPSGSISKKDRNIGTIWKFACKSAMIRIARRDTKRSTQTPILIASEIYKAPIKKFKVQST